MGSRFKVLGSKFWVLGSFQPLTVIAGSLIENESEDSAHPQALKNTLPNAEEVMQEVNGLITQWEEGNLSLEAQNIIKDKLRYLQSRCDWLKNQEQKLFIQEKIVNRKANTLMQLV